MANDFAQREVEFLLGIGGIKIEYGKALGRDISLNELKQRCAAVFIGAGITATNALGVPGENLSGVYDALHFIEDLRQAKDKSLMRVGRNVVVIGGGNTAIDAAIQSKRLGAENVTMVYRRGAQSMTATEWERDLARTNEVVIKTWAMPIRMEGTDKVAGAVFERSAMQNGKLFGTGETFTIPTDMVLKAIGQKLYEATFADMKAVHHKTTDEEKNQTTIPGAFAGGDCIVSG